MLSACRRPGAREHIFSAIPAHDVPPATSTCHGKPRIDHSSHDISPSCRGGSSHAERQRPPHCQQAVRRSVSKPIGRAAPRSARIRSATLSIHDDSISQLTLTAAKDYASDCHVLLLSRGTVTDLVMGRLAFVGRVDISSRPPAS